MFGTKAVVTTAFFLVLSTSLVWAGDPTKDAADRQQAVEHSKEVHRMKQREQDHAPELRNQDPMERARERNRKAREKEALEIEAHEKEAQDADLDDDAVDGSD